MSIPNFPPDMTKICWDQALSMVVASIAMEELALSHILNAEGEKLQYVLGTLHKDQSWCASTGDILRVNESIGSILDKVETNQILLKGKLEQAIKANQQHPRKPCIYHSIEDFCWSKGNPLPWLPQEKTHEMDMLGCPLTSIVIPSGKSVLLSYSFTLEPTTGERNAAILVRKMYEPKQYPLAVVETHVCCQETKVHLCGCVVVPSTGCEGRDDQIEFVLSTPCCVCVKHAMLTVSAL